MNQMKFPLLTPLCLAVLPLALPAPTPAQDSGTAVPQKVVASVVSKDGTTIAYERTGQGPPVILVSSALADRTGNKALARLLAPTATVFNYDRRGRGESGDGKAYAVEREVEDIAALIEAAGGSARLFGSSSGAALALEAADKLKGRVSAVALFEPPYIVDNSRPPIPESLIEEIRVLVTKDRRCDAVAMFMTECVGVPVEMLDGMKKSPMWRSMEKLAHTIPYDGAIVAGLQAGKPLPDDRWRSITAPTLVIDGERSEPFARNSVAALVRTLPNAKRHTLPGRDHSAVFMAPSSLIPPLVEFFAASQRGVSAPPAAGRKEHRQR